MLDFAQFSNSELEEIRTVTDKISRYGYAIKFDFVHGFELWDYNHTDWNSPDPNLVHCAGQDFQSIMDHETVTDIMENPLDFP